MKHKRVISVLLALSLIAVINITTPTSNDSTSVKAINSDLMWLTISSFEQVNKQVQECSHNSNCDK